MTADPLEPNGVPGDRPANGGIVPTGKINKLDISLIYEILAEYTAFQSREECRIIEFIHINRHHKETLVKYYKNFNIVIPRLPSSVA